ncbi:MAG: NAD dependent epimerase/dehydratase family [Candidatus Peregrinibacteria bacterium Greene0416_62]|nr:MAG: NAD dependent epimerase/dehydratase family [Candidatus Peregrinibacteria bacterium Greene0416_62]TSD00431.1 MAG: NAD dependent epimerase/dehydratase family [Candidatus Peregrinibacteria bacterium Greene1014_49]
MKILVTGSSGTIGTRLCETLLAKGYDVIGADWLPNKWNPEVNKRTILVDLRDEAAIANCKLQIANRPIDVIIHLAANARVYELVEDPPRALDNFITLFNTLELARKNGIKKFFFAGSREGYGNIQVDRLTEDLVRVENCESPYTASKVGGEALVHAYTRCYGIDHVIIRFSNVYGAYDNSVRVVPLFIRQARRNETLKIFGKEKCLDFTYIDDAVDGVIKALEKFDAVKNGTYNLAFGEGNTILKLAEMIIELTGSKSKIELGESRTGEVIHYVADISKAKKAFGFDPKIPFAEGVKKAVEWYAANT